MGIVKFDIDDPVGTHFIVSAVSDVNSAKMLYLSQTIVVILCDFETNRLETEPITNPSTVISETFGYSTNTVKLSWPINESSLGSRALSMTGETGLTKSLLESHCLAHTSLY